MSKEQIWEMTEDICEIHNKGMKCDVCDMCCHCRMSAEAMYNLGYRKQREPSSCGRENGGGWISVKERLPKKFAHVLCLYPSKGHGSNIVVDYMESDRGYFAEQFRYGEPTHWMPLPEPPAEKENRYESNI